MAYQTFTLNKKLNKKANRAKSAASKLLLKTFGANENSQWDKWTFDPISGGVGLLEGGYYLKGTIAGQKVTTDVLVSLNKKGKVIRYGHSWYSDSDSDGVGDEGFNYSTRVVKGLKGLRKHTDYMTTIYDYFILDMSPRWADPTAVDSVYLSFQIDRMPGADSIKNSSTGASFLNAEEWNETQFN